MNRPVNDPFKSEIASLKIVNLTPGPAIQNCNCARLLRVESDWTSGGRKAVNENQSRVAKSNSDFNPDSCLLEKTVF